ncbi:MAG: hypothetical protein E7614_08560 [Ruminococcaceae bacterium]|nr:hypothetical protein [Oscillospiraceae bacterium]
MDDNNGGDEVEFVLEFLITVWLELGTRFALGFVKTDKAKSTCKYIVIGILLYVVIAFTLGAIMITEQIGSPILAIFLMSSSAVVFIVQFVLGIVFYKK